MKQKEKLFAEAFLRLPLVTAECEIDYMCHGVGYVNNVYWKQHFPTRKLHKTHTTIITLFTLYNITF